MLKFIGKALTGLVLTREGKEAAAQLAGGKPGAKPVAPKPAKAAAKAKGGKGAKGAPEEASDEIYALLDTIMAEARTAVRAEMAQDALDNAKNRLDSAEAVRAKALELKAKAAGKAVARATLISNALSVHKAKQAILADLSDEHRAKLVAIAMKALLNQGPGKG